jgi:hypothetical protein
MEIITVNNIEKEFTLVESIFGDLKNYHREIEYMGFGKFCDVYLMCEEKPNKNQIDILNKFNENYKEKLAEIDKLIIKKKNLTDSEQIEKIKNSMLYLDVIFIPEKNPKYEMVIVCSKTYKSMYIFKKTINIRIEYKNGQIKSSEIKKNTAEDNN